MVFYYCSRGLQVKQASSFRDLKRMLFFNQKERLLQKALKAIYTHPSHSRIHKFKRTVNFLKAAGSFCYFHQVYMTRYTTNMKRDNKKGNALSLHSLF